MANAPKVYTRLKRSPVSLGTYKSLWMAADHLMQVDSNGYSESYSRFYFTDIQGFFIGPSGQRLYWSIFWGVIALFSGIPFIAGLLREESLGISAIFFAISSAFLIWNILPGPSCHVFLVTRVQTVRLGSLVRRRKAVKVLGRLQPLIEEAQRSPAAPVSSDTPPAGVPSQEAVPTPPSLQS